MSGTLTLLGCLFVLDRYVEAAGGNYPQRHVFVPRPNMWRADPVVGFVNKGNFEHTVFGNVTGRTNAEGFRSEWSYPLRKDPGTVRIFALGDSVTWGVRVNAEDSYPGQLEQMLRSRGLQVEVIDGGVVGYATHQEYLFLDRHALAYEPDIVLVNHCTNDWLPSEDPFQNVEGIYASYFRWLTEEGRNLLDPFQESVLSLLMEDARETVHNALLPFVFENDRGTKFGDPEIRDALRRILLEIPMLRMHRLAKRNGARLIVLFIPSTIPSEIQLDVRDKLMATLKSEGVETIDLLADLHEDLAPYHAQRDLRSLLHNAVLVDSGLSTVASALSMRTLDAPQSFARLARLRDLERIHDNLNFVDLTGHPSRKGNRIIARRISEYLAMGEEASP